MSRLLLLRLAAGDDLVAGLEAAARTHGVRHGRIHAGPGSLDHAHLQLGDAIVHAPGPGAEILVMIGDVQDGQVSLHGVVGDPDGRVYAGRFIRGRNPVCITVELALEYDDAPPEPKPTGSSPATGSWSAQ